MSRLVKLLWIFTSYAPLMLVIGVALFIDSFTTKQVTNCFLIGAILFLIGLLCVPGSYGIIVLAKREISKSRISVVSASPGDNHSLSSMIAYLLPLVTLSLADVNLWVLYAMILMIVIMLLWTKAIFVNPLLYFFKYRYYEIQLESGVTYTLLSKQKRFNPTQVGTVIELFDEIYMEV